MSLVILQIGPTRLAVARGERLLDQLDDVRKHGLPLACRSANCGICRVKVIQGERSLAPAEADEQALLRRCGAEPNERLACQLTIAADADGGEIVLRPAGRP